MTLAILTWLFGGGISFILNIRKIIRFAKEVFLVTETFLKYSYYVVAFLVHVVGGLISLAVVLYNKFKGA